MRLWYSIIFSLSLYIFRIAQYIISVILLVVLIDSIKIIAVTAFFTPCQKLLWVLEIVIPSGRRQKSRFFSVFLAFPRFFSCFVGYGDIAKIDIDIAKIALLAVYRSIIAICAEFVQ